MLNRQRLDNIIAMNKKRLAMADKSNKSTVVKNYMKE